MIIEERLIEEVNQHPLIITQKLVYPNFEMSYDEESDVFYLKFNLDKNKLFCDEYGIDCLDLLLTILAFKQSTCDVPLLVTKQDLDLIYSLEIKNPIINLDDSNITLQ
ncbi:TPA: hypothetical protein R4341_001157 [Pasteurella multocida]|uniref:Uncharacterized protein n=1 Tax=Pasteurella oralis TaxID=1071947 RepID=A0ABW4NU29_9PAST|nr:hypothetical protein [Pasteurella multocida]AKD39449.1 hypothetical protein I927_01035 [Pasteurella multocida OH1905]MCL7758956.1 hypothetical protein [Pasteurella multocida]MCL7771418.1 hypothetical protein [Pasteurella multocida]MCL7803004.1 hypothetical protein [Pasteurella multocida]MCL7820932.1 hypothetical protein [Pasteurella multocida]